MMVFGKEAFRFKILLVFGNIAYFEQDKRLYLVQELIERQNLLEELQQQGTFSEEKIRQLLADLLPVLKIVHELGVIHRDIKPENIMRRRTPPQSSPYQRGARGGLMLIDFGVSKQVTATILGQAGTTVGTPGYAPMEQMRGQVYPASDLYSLGVTCIRLLTQCLPKEDDSDELYDALEGRWIWRERLPQGTTISPELGQVLDKLIQDYVKERYQSAAEVLQALNSATSRPTNLSATIPATVITTTANNLSPAVMSDYGKLEELLAAGKWQEANRETKALMLKAAGREKDGWLRAEDIEWFSCEDLRTINKLWFTYSNGRFGFSVQKRIWQSLCGNKRADWASWCRFGERVGWHVNAEWLLVDQLTFTLSAPIGHLPAGSDSGCGGGGYGRWNLFSRVEACGL